MHYMTNPNVIITVAAFIFFVITNVIVFLLLAKNMTKLSPLFCLLLTSNFTLWALHGYSEHDISLMYSAGFGALTSGIIFGRVLYYKLTSK